MAAQAQRGRQQEEVMEQEEDAGAYAPFNIEALQARRWGLAGTGSTGGPQDRCPGLCGPARRQLCVPRGQCQPCALLAGR